MKHGHPMKVNTIKKRLVFYGGKFGLEFSGGCIATCRIFEEIQIHFNEIIVITHELGKHHIQNLKYKRCTSIDRAIPIIQSLDDGNTLFYGDFYDAIAFVRAKVPFCFTYHDNWPEQSQLSLADEEKSHYFIPIYQQIFQAATKIFSVSNYKSEFIRKYTDRIVLLRNGLNHPIRKNIYVPFKKENGALRILMTGNIDARKYSKAILLFEELRQLDIKLEIDIYGWQHDKGLSNSLDAFDFVHLKGYKELIFFENYDTYLSTSFIENLSISVVEALKNKMPVICFDVGGLGEVVNDDNGKLIPAFEIDKMAVAIKNIYQENVYFQFVQDDLSDFDWKVSGRRFLEEVI
ncbi:MAG: glycosyltransferase involved in cell wall biosynthesis [Maribacter sp.]|jgi:glycosyltransferase involved in cell wall biosynthesis